MSDLTWEQREQVLRELFARMNGNKTKSNKTTTDNQTLAIESNKNSSHFDGDDDDEDKTVKFLDRSDLKKPEENLGLEKLR